MKEEEKNNATNFLETISTTKKNLDIFLELLDKEISMPNLPMKTMGGEVFWNTLAESNGWKMQQNMITHNARILNEENVRVAWGTLNGMKKAMNTFLKAY